MTRTDFYEVPPKTWLFPEDRKNQPKEEPVRQWCAFELMRAYGISIRDLEFEGEVTVGSKSYYVDILVRREGKPWIVVECKEPGHKQHEKAMEQAISYADCQRVQAEFALYTNGKEWRVKRRVSGRWINVVDLPITDGRLADRDLVGHLGFLEHLKPLLRTLDQPIQGTEAAAFFEALQSFFTISHRWYGNMDGFLISATDSLLRLLALPEGHPRYHLGKLGLAMTALNHYIQDRGLGTHTLALEPTEDIRQQLQGLRTDWRTFIAPTSGGDTLDAPLISLITTLLDYSDFLPAKPRQFPPIPSALQTRLREFLDAVLRCHFGLILPGVDDSLNMDDLRTRCTPQRRSWWQ